MAPKKIVPKGTDDIIELTDIVEEGKLPPEDTGGGLTDASFEDELDSMLADVPELSAAARELEDMAGPAAPVAPAAPAPAAGDDDLADLDSLLEGLDDDLAAKPPAPKSPPKAAAPADDVLLDVDDLLAEAGAADKTDIAPTAPAVDDDASVDDFLAEFADADSAGQPEGATASSASAIDGATVDADELLAELQSASEPAVEEDDLLAELKSVMGGAAEQAAAAAEGATEVEMPASEPAPAADPFEAAMAAANPAPADPFEAAMAVAEPAVETAPADPCEAAMAAADPVSADPFEAAMAAAEPGVEPAASLAEEGLTASAEAAPQAPDAAPAVDAALDAEDLQQLDALLDDILQPGAGAGQAPVEEDAALAGADEPPAAASEGAFETAPAMTAAPVDAAALTAELLADDGPLLATVRDLVRQELEERMAALEERLTQNLDKAAAQAAAQIIREEIAALAQELVD